AEIAGPDQIAAIGIDLQNDPILQTARKTRLENTPRDRKIRTLRRSRYQDIVRSIQYYLAPGIIAIISYQQIRPLTMIPDLVVYIHTIIPRSPDPHTTDQRITCRIQLGHEHIRPTTGPCRRLERKILGIGSPKHDEITLRITDKTMRR